MMMITVNLKAMLVPHCRGRQGPAPGQPHANLMERLHSPLGAGQRPAPGALMRAGASAEELRLKEERLEQERAAQRKREAEAKRKAEVRIAGYCSPQSVPFALLTVQGGQSQAQVLSMQGSLLSRANAS